MNMFQNIWYWRLAIFEVVCDAYIAGAMVWTAAVADKEWSALTPTARTFIYIAASIAIIRVFKAFLSTTIKDLKDAKPAAEEALKVAAVEEKAAIVATAAEVAAAKKLLEEPVASTTQPNEPKP